MTVRYNTCGNCNHPSSKHSSNGVCGVRGCTCKNFKPKES